MLPYVENNPTNKASATVIWLHGLGADGHDFAPIVPALNLPQSHGIRFIFPHAPSRPVTLNNGYVMPAWFDVHALSLDAKIDEAGIVAAGAQINELIAQEQARGIPANRIVLAGFSQGGALALQAGLTQPETLAGVMGLSTFLPIADKLAGSKLDLNVPIFMAHGIHDMVVPFAWGVQSCEALRKVGFSPEWHEYPMGHEVCQPEITAISQWLQRLLG